jgi:hypothetical protein
MDARRREALLKEYGEVSSSFRLLTDIRFKLLAFLPTAAAAAAFFKGENTSIAGAALSMFGLAATLGLVTYNARNDQLYDELVGRASSIERSLGLPDGAFANRPAPWLTIRILKLSWEVNHRSGVGLIYAATVSLWLYGLLGPALGYAARFSVEQELLRADPEFVQIAALVLAIATTAFTVRLIKRQKKHRQIEMRIAARNAVSRALEIETAQAWKDDELVELCAQLSGEKQDSIRARAKFFSHVAPESLGYYLPRGSREQTACHFVAHLTDMPPQWLFDCKTNRRGSLKENQTSGSAT